MPSAHEAVPAPERRRLATALQVGVCVLVCALELLALVAVHVGARTPAQALAGFGAVLASATALWALSFVRFVRESRRVAVQLAAAEQLARSESRFRALVAHTADVVLVVDLDARVTFATPSCAALLGRDADSLQGALVVDVFSGEEAALRHALVRAADGESVRLSLRTLTGSDADQGSGRTAGLGSGRLLEGRIDNLVAEQAVGGLVITLRDVTDQRALEERLVESVFSDPLTGLANCVLLGERLERALSRSEGSGAAVLFVNLDGFKAVNDGLGHSVGDEILRACGTRIAELVGSGDTAARIGGDEFVVLLERGDESHALVVADRIVSAIAEPLVVAGREITLTCTVGVAGAGPSSGLDEDELLRRADIAMYVAKDGGGGGVAAFTEDMLEALQARMELHAELQHAIAAGQLVLHYQPTVALASGGFEGVEALVRRQHPVRGLVPPDEFIPAAEESGLVVPLGRWVLREACRAIAGLQTPGRKLTVGVNVAARHLEEAGFVDEVLEVLAATGLPAHLLVLELTETAVVQDVMGTRARLDALRSHGVRVAVDDFGTGYSSLAYLDALPVDVLKVDQSFVARMAEGDGADSAVVQAILQMGRTLGLQTIGEGVETPAQADALGRLDCDLVQGFLYSRPVPLDALRTLPAGPPLAPPRGRNRPRTARNAGALPVQPDRVGA